MKIAAALIAFMLAFVGTDSFAQPSLGATLSQAEINAIVASPDRRDADRTIDQRRKPEQLLAFIGIRRGMIALDISASAGYTSELLARAIGPTGKVYGQGWAGANARPAEAATPITRPDGSVVPPPATKRVKGRAATFFAERIANMGAAGVVAAPMEALARPFENPAPPDLADGGFDLVTLIFNYHDFGHMGVDRDALNRAVYRVLKPGGMFIIADHAGRDGTGISESGTLHRIEEAFLKREVLAAGFTLAAEGTFLRNSNDPRDRNVPDPPMPKDEFVLKFVKR